MKRVAFPCSRNRRRSPNAERVFGAWPGIEASPAGFAPDAEEPLTSEALEGGDIVVVMERAHPHGCVGGSGRTSARRG